MNRASTLLTLALLTLLPACRTSSSGSDGSEGEGWHSPWLKPSPLLAQQIQDEADRLPWTHGIEHLEQIRWFAAVGEPAYPTLLELAVDERPNVAAAALASLGATHDKRLVPSLRALEWPAVLDDDNDLSLERARTLVRLGDWSEIPRLIAGLADERQHVRALCDQTLYEATRQRFGFDPRGSDSERDLSIRRWEDWWLKRTGEGLLVSER